MPYSKFATFNVLGALIWVLSFTGAGFFFGSQPWVQKNFTAVVLAIICLSGVPLAIEVNAAKKEAAMEEALLPGIRSKQWKRYWGFKA